MLKALATSALALAALVGGTLVVVACSNDDGSEFEGPPKPDAEDGPISPLVPGEGGGPDAGAGEGGPPGTCTAAIPDPFTPTWKAPTRVESACSASDLKAYWDACLANPGTTEPDGTCAKFKTAHPTCAACAEPADNSGPIQWFASRKLQVVNFAGCIEVTQIKAGAAATGCGEAYSAAVQCARESCESCVTVAQSFPLYQACRTEVQNKGICKGFEDAKTAPCAGYRDPGAPAVPCFPSANETAEVVTTRVVGLICGPP